MLNKQVDKAQMILEQINDTVKKLTISLEDEKLLVVAVEDEDEKSN